MDKNKLSRRTVLLLPLGGLIGAVCAPLFASGPPNSGASQAKDKKKVSNELKVPEGREVATLAAGCFWCVEAIFQGLKGVDKAVSGYTGGHVVNPSYEQVCEGNTGHAEAIQIIFDPKVISFADLLHIFFTTHDPTTLNRQGADSGTQYRSGIFYHSPQQKETAEKVIKEITTDKLYNDPIVTEVTAYKNFYVAEDYHQKYYARNGAQPYCMMVIAPKVRKFREKYRHLLK
jgi:peptide-methionine (S)-S-oxide reductase